MRRESEREKRWWAKMLGCRNTKENGTIIFPFFEVIQWNRIECWRWLLTETWNTSTDGFFTIINLLLFRVEFIFVFVFEFEWSARSIKWVFNENLCAKQCLFCLIKNKTESCILVLCLYIDKHRNSARFHAYCVAMLANRVNLCRTTWGDFSTMHLTTAEYNNVYLHFVILFHLDCEKHERELFQSLHIHTQRCPSHKVLGKQGEQKTNL